MSGSSTLAQGLELDVIAAVIIGGTSFSGGVGTVRGTLIGILFIGVIQNGMPLLNLDIYFQYIVRGGLILAAVLVNRLQEARKARDAPTPKTSAPLVIAYARYRPRSGIGSSRMCSRKSRCL